MLVGSGIDRGGVGTYGDNTNRNLGFVLGVLLGLFNGNFGIDILLGNCVGASFGHAIGTFSFGTLGQAFDFGNVLWIVVLFYSEGCTIGFGNNGFDRFA